jgi:excisionase family DNA binding protein
MTDRMNKAEAAVKAGVSESTVTRAIQAGELPAVKEPRRVLIKSADCEAWIRSRRQPIERKERSA